MIEETIRETLPEGFQRAEYLREHGMVDLVVPRGKMRETLIRLLRLLMQPGSSSPARDLVARADAARRVHRPKPEDRDASAG